MNMGFQLKVR